MDPVDVETFVRIKREPDGRWSVTQFHAEGSVRVPEHAVREEHNGVVRWAWTEAGHVHDAECPRCMSAETCVQRVEVTPSTRSVMVTHEHEERLN